MASARRKARAIVIQALYEIDTAAHEPEATLERHLAESALPPEAQAFARRLVEGGLGHHQAIDHQVRGAAPTWPLEQMSKVDLNILRLAIFEILFDNEVPLKVAINEAIELAKTFGSDNSPKFVNGVLGAIATETQSQARRS